MQTRSIYFTYGGIVLKIVLVIDQFDNSNNGTTITARRFAEQLRRRGHEVTVIAAGTPEPNKVVVPKHRIPLFQHLIESQGMYFAKPLDKAYYQAFKDADIVHFFMPFRFCRRGESLARQMHIPTVAAFHVQPQNITYTLFLGRTKCVNEWLYNWFYNIFYNRFNYIHCPSQFIADELEAHNYGAHCCVISNGVDNVFTPSKSPCKNNNETIRILMIGRLSREKRQDLIIKAANLSKYRDKIQLIFAGKGPSLSHYQKLSTPLPHKPIFDFYSEKDLVRLIHCCDLYVHASDIEIEGISCMEAFSSGLVPIISNSPLSATRQFSLDPRCLFEAGSAQSLAEQIDYWIEHPKEKQKLSQKYAEYGDRMRVKQCVIKTEKLYQEVINDFKKNGPRQVTEHKLKRWTHPDPNKAAAQYRTGWKGKEVIRGLITNILSPILYLIDSLFWGFSIEGRKNLKTVNGGAITVMNHIHPMDCTMVKLATFPHRTYFTSMPENIALPFVGWLIKWLGAIPLPRKISGKADLERRIEKGVDNGDWIHYFAEGLLVRYHEEVRPFFGGAFLPAVRSGCPVIPMRLICQKPHGIRKLWRKKPFLHLIIGEPLYSNPDLKGSKAVKELSERTYQAVAELGQHQD